MASCWKFMRQIDDPGSLVNCGSCVKYDRQEQRCRDEDEVIADYGIKRYQETKEFNEFKNMMEKTISIVIT